MKVDEKEKKIPLFKMHSSAKFFVIFDHNTVEVPAGKKPKNANKYTSIEISIYAKATLARLTHSSITKICANAEEEQTKSNNNNQI